MIRTVSFLKVGKGSRKGRAVFRNIALALFMGIFSLALAACAGGDQAAEETPLSYTDVTAQYVPADGPSDLVKFSDLVVTGETGTPTEGRIWGSSGDDPTATPSTVMIPIAVSSVKRGSLPEGSGGTVYLEIFTSDGPSRKSLMEGLRSRKGIFYLWQTPDPLRGDTEIVNEDAGRPLGQPTFQAASPEGILIETGDEDQGIWSVGVATEFPRAKLENFLPNRSEFPPASD